MPLPLREYYRLPRAAELLGCEVDDLLHWAKMRKIYLCINLKDAKGKIDVFDWRNDYQSLVEKYGFPSIKGAAPKKDQLLFSLNIMSDERNREKCREVLKSSFNIIELIIDGVIDEDSVCKIYIGSNYAIGILSEVSGNHVSVDVDLDGVFMLFDDSFYDNIYDCIIEDYSTILSPKNGLIMNLYLDDAINLNVSDFFILKSDFLKIKEASNEGGEIYIDDEWSREYETSKPEKAVRTSSKAKLAINLMAKKLYVKECKSPTQLANTLTAEAHKQGLEVTFDDATVARWLEK